VIKNRYDVYQEETARVFDYYASFGISLTVNGLGSIEEIFGRLCHVIDSMNTDFLDDINE
jgi:adenylate kinase